VSLASIEDKEASARATKADLLVFCYPTYYLKPAPPMRQFIEGLGQFMPIKPCYIITTCELYSENSMRRMARILVTKGLAVSGWKALRAPGSDITAVLDDWLVPWLYRFGRSFEERLSTAADEILAAAEDSGLYLARWPLPRWYTPLTQLLQILVLNHFDLVKYRLKSLDERCTHCGFCASACPTNAITLTDDKIRIEARQCILCCRCIHGCPRQALVLSDRLKDNRRIDAVLLSGLKAQAWAAMEPRL
jgi:ferredoxin